MSEQKLLKLMSWPIKLPSNYFTGLLMINHPPVEGGCISDWGKIYEKVDESFLKTLCDYFEDRLKNDSVNTESIVWSAIVPTHAEFIELLKSRKYDELNEYLKFCGLLNNRK